MYFLYNIGIFITNLGLKIIAPFNKKIALFINGRKDVFSFLDSHISTSDRVLWFHTASLGEFEQGLPVIEGVRNDFPQHKILVTFFSPSGYEVKKNSQAAHMITYLPLDSKKNATRFLDLVKPEIAVFVKYEFWPNYLNELEKRKIPTLLISAIFRKEQAFFKWYGGFIKQSLSAFAHFFVQDENSRELLKSIGFYNTTVSGDTRFDRVSEILSKDNQLDFMEVFKGDHLCVVAGSTWPEDNTLLIPFINQEVDGRVKFVIVPHDIKEIHVSQLEKKLTKKTLRYSKIKEKNLADYEVLIVDTIGLLTKIYHYANIAYVGGGMGSSGLHNTLEPAVYGIPVLIGDRYQSFKEARDLVALGGIVSVSNAAEFKETLNGLLTDKKHRSEIGAINNSYIRKNRGADIQIRNFIRTLQQK